MIELTGEAAYESARLAQPDRVYFDFANAVPGSALADRAAALTGVLVKNVRVGRRDGATRVVLDLHGEPRYRVYRLANPFRVVIEVESETVVARVTEAAGVSKVVGASSPLDLGRAVVPGSPLGRPSEARASAAALYVGALSTFTLDKPAVMQTPLTAGGVTSTLAKLPTRHETLRTTVGLGYVQGASWGSEFQSAGSISGLQLQLDGLLTGGSQGLRLERGAVMLSDPDRHWRVEAGDLSSYLGGSGRGARLSWSGRGNRSPSIAAITPRISDRFRSTVLTYRDQIRWRQQTLLDAEIASDRSFYAATRLSLGRLDVELSNRTLRRTDRNLTDRGISLGVGLWRGAAVYATGIRSDDADERSDWVSAGMRVPIVRWFELGLERTFVSTGETSTRASAVTASLLTNRVRLAHRYQWGENDLLFGDISRSIAREQYQAMASWTPGPRLNATLQLVTSWNDHGRAQSWEELQATLAMTRSTFLSLATPVQPNGNYDRMRLGLVQRLPRGFAVTADYGRVLPFQPELVDDGRPRMKMMVSRTVNLATPARGGVVSGTITDHAGQPVAGARVVLGPYSVTTGRSGAYIFSPLPAGTYELTVDEEDLPAGYASDGRRARVEVTRDTRETVNLRVTPLNAVHGRVFIDRNANTHFDAGEGVTGAVVRMADRVTATDDQGAYSFFNVWPGRYAVLLDVVKLPENFVAGDRVSIDIVLGDDRPVTGVDFVVQARVKPIKWAGARQ